MLKSSSPRVTLGLNIKRRGTRSPHWNATTTITSRREEMELHHLSRGWDRLVIFWSIFCWILKNLGFCLSIYHFWRIFWIQKLVFFWGFLLDLELYQCGFHSTSPSSNCLSAFGSWDHPWQEVVTVDRRSHDCMLFRIISSQGEFENHHFQ